MSTGFLDSELSTYLIFPTFNKVTAYVRTYSTMNAFKLVFSV